MRQDQFVSSNKSVHGVMNYESVASENNPVFGNMIIAMEKILLTRMMRAIGNPPLQIVLWNGQKISNHEGREVAQVFIRDRGALMKLIADPELYFGEMYSANRIDVNGNFLDFLDTVYRVWPLRKSGKIGKKLLFPNYDIRRNTLSGSRRNIQHHYDIGNDFYKLWLDKNMLYTCAYFQNQSDSLEDAQFAKMDHVCRKLRLQPGENVVEAGCGWGSLALHMARYYGVTVKAYNISKEQVNYARRQALADGLDGKVEFIEEDYRDIQGQFDAFVSVGMLEHVGTDNYEALGAVIDRSLTDSGRGLIHSIGLNYPRPMDAWAERNIFPGGNPPSLAQMMSIFEPYDFSVLDVENLRLHYAKTLEHWLQRYEENINLVTEMFDFEFARAWRLYLAGSLTAFKNGGMQLFQVSFARAGNNQIPLTRHYLYETQPDPQGESYGKL
jgi:cyclopropane-fatty-acyl-phospholipid synthase